MVCLYFCLKSDDLPSPPPLTTDGTTEVVSTAGYSALYQSSKGDDSEILPTIFAGCAAGVVLIMFIVVLVMCICINKKEKDQQVLYSM